MNAAQQNKSDHFAQVDNGNQSPGKDGVAVKPYSGTAKYILGLTYETQQDAFLGGYEAAAYAATHNAAAPKVAHLRWRAVQLRDLLHGRLL